MCIKQNIQKIPVGRGKALPQFEEAVLFIRARKYPLNLPWEFGEEFWDLTGDGSLLL